MSNRDTTFFRKGFTIIELLVVVAIIALIASLVLVQFQVARARARDAQREHDIKTLQTALALYVTNKGTFPVYSGPICPTMPCSDALSVALLDESVLPGIPKDPVNTDVLIYSYVSAGSTYALSYTLETDSIPGKSSGAQTATP